MVGRDHRTEARFLFFAAVLGALLSQPGHFAAYLARYGPASLDLQSSGVHAYFPGVLGGSLAAFAAAVLGALLLVAGGRIAYGRALGLRAADGVAAARLLPLLLLVQLNVYLLQEMLEASALRHPLTPAAIGGIAAWGLAGQLPLAILASLALAWLSRPLVAALRALRSPFALALIPGFEPWPVLAPTVIPSSPFFSRRRQLLGAATRRRGPPPPR